MLVCGVLLICEVLVTLIWQEPFTALYASGRQAAASSQLRALERAKLPASASAQLAGLKGADARMTYLAQRLRTHARPGQALGRIQIPHIGVSFTFVQDTDANSLTKGPGHYADTVLPGEHGTVAIAGHRTTYLAPFRRIDRLHRGDRVVLTMPYHPSGSSDSTGTLSSTPERISAATASRRRRMAASFLARSRSRYARRAARRLHALSDGRHKVRVRARHPGCAL